MTRSRDLSRRPPQATQRKYQDNKCLDLSQLPHSDLLPKFSHKKSANENPRAWEEWLKWAFISFLGKEQGDTKDRIMVPFKDAPLLTAGIGDYRHVTLWVQWIKFTGWIKVAEQVTLRWRDHPELPGWALCSHERPWRWTRGAGETPMWRFWLQRWTKGPQVKGCGRPPASRIWKKPGKGFSPRTSRKSQSPADTPILAHWDLCETSEL